MKGLLTFSFLLSFWTAFADCGHSNHASLWPDTDSLSTVPTIILTGYRASNDIVNEMPSKYPTFLKSNNHKVPLQRVEINEGANGQCQLVLRPTEPLTAGMDYELVIENLPHAKSYFHYDTAAVTSIKKWRIVDVTSNVSPCFLSKPKNVGDTIQMYGCGLEHHVDFSYKAASPANYRVKTVLKELPNGPISTYYILTENGLIEVGRHMCGGAFNLVQASKYQVEFTLVNIWGQHSKTSSGKIEFTAPEFTYAAIDFPENFLIDTSWRLSWEMKPQ